jgi:hypothetical protein
VGTRSRFEVQSPQGEIPSAKVQYERAARYGHNLNHIRGGKPLPEEVRQSLEPAFGQDFSDVRVQESGEPEALGAAAFTRGSEIHFARGRYQPASLKGRKLLAHELTHVVQQREGRVAPGGGRAGINADRRLEAEAERVEAGHVPAGPAPAPSGPAAPASVPVQLGKFKVGDDLDFDHMSTPRTGKVTHVEQDSEKDEEAIYHVEHKDGTFRIQNGKVIHLDSNSNSMDWFNLDSPPGTPTLEPLSPLLTDLDDLDVIKDLHQQVGQGHGLFQSHMFKQPGFSDELRALTESTLSGTTPPITNRATQNAFLERSLQVMPHAKKPRELQMTPHSSISYGAEYVNNRGGNSKRHVPPTLPFAHVDFDLGPTRAMERPDDYPDSKLEDDIQIEIEKISDNEEKAKRLKNEKKKAVNKKIQDTYKKDKRYPAYDGSYPGLTSYTKDRGKEFGVSDKEALSLINQQGPDYEAEVEQIRKKVKTENPSEDKEKRFERYMANFERIGTLQEDEYARRPSSLFPQQVARREGSLDALLNPLGSSAIMTDKKSATTVESEYGESEKNRLTREQFVYKQVVSGVKEKKPEYERYRRTVNAMASAQKDPSKKKDLQKRFAREERHFRQELSSDPKKPFTARPTTTTTTGQTITNAMIQTPWTSMNSKLPTGSLSASNPETTKAHELYSMSEDDWGKLPKDFQTQSQGFLDRMHDPSNGPKTTKAKITKITDEDELREFLEKQHMGGGLDWEHLAAIPGLSEDKMADLKLNYPNVSDLFGVTAKKLKENGAGATMASKIMNALKGLS